MRLCIRADASVDMGIGHVMRCLTLAERWRARGAAVTFVCRELPGHVCDAVEARGFDCRRLRMDEQAPLPDGWQQDAQRTAEQFRDGAPVDLLIVDHYGLDARWERALRAIARRLFVIDDLADRPHDCEVLLDQNLHDSPQHRYDGLVPPGARVFVGPRYALLRPEFDAVSAAPRTAGVRSILVFFGGADAGNEAGKVLQALRQLPAPRPTVRVVLGPSNPHLSALGEAARGLAGVELIERTQHMAQLMAEADLGLGTCGGAAWERCAVGLPTLVVITADNQRDDARLLHQLGAVRNLGEAAAVDARIWADALSDVLGDAQALARMSRAAAAVMHDRAAAASELERALAG